MTIHTDPISAMAGQTIACTCGHTHSVPIRHIATGTGALNALADILAPFGGKRVFLMGDAITMALGRDAVYPYLTNAGCRVREHVFACPPENHLVTNETLIGSVLVHMEPDTALIAAVGSGTMNDVARVVATRCGIPFIIVATAPSMDGYASSTSAVVMDGGKYSVLLQTPHAIVGDPQLMKTAPDHMLAAGAGDMLGKFIAIRDWQLTSRENDEYYCPEIAQLVLASAERCAADLPALFDRSEAVLDALTNSLILAGIAISMYGTSRPAAGMEHQMAHSWEVHAILGGTNAYLHGNYVGLGTLVACRLYEMASETYTLPGADRMPSYTVMQTYNRQLRGYSSLPMLKINKDVFRAGILHASQPDIRYSLASYLRQQGTIETYADRLTDEFFS